MKTLQPVFRNQGKRCGSCPRRFAPILLTCLAVTWTGGLVAVPPPQANDRGVQRQKQRNEHRMRIAEEEYRKRAFPLDAVPEGAMARAMKQTQAFETRTRGPLSPGVYFWYALGPAPITVSGDQPTCGRVSAVAVDPANSFHWLIGAAQGGIWETYDLGSTWVARTDDQASLASGAIAFAPSAPSTVYAGTGEPNFSGDSYAGAGLLVSHNNGTNWQMLNSSFAQTSISSIKVNPTSASQLSLSTVRGVAGKVGRGTANPPNAPQRGVFYSVTGGSSFTRALTGEATDLAMDPFNFNRQYAGLGEIFGAATNGVYRTTNHWTSSEFVNGPWTALAAPTNIGRIALAVAPSSSQTVYVGIAFDADHGGLVGIWRVDNAWSTSPTYTQLPDPSVYGIPWYAFALTVDPTDASTIYMSEFSIQRYSGGFWSDIGQFIHPDNHVMAWVPWVSGLTPTPRILLGNDGGVWFSSPPVSANWSSMNGGGLAISQMYKGSVHPQPNNAMALAGLQDNGTVRNEGKLAWPRIQDADGSDNAIAATNPDKYWATSWESLPYPNIYRTQDAGTNLDLVTEGMAYENAPFFVHFEKSPRNDDLFIAGLFQLWRCTNFFSGTVPQWTSNSPIMLNSLSAPVAISAMAFAPSDTNGLIYAFATTDGQLRITSNAGGLWNNLDPANGVPDRFVSGMAFSPTDSNVLYVALSGFDEGTPGHPGHLFKATNALSATPGWIDISPPVNLPMDCLAINAQTPSTIFVGSDIGVWLTSNGGGGWTHLGPPVGMPNVAVYDLKMNSVGQVTAFTHGRGAFTYAPGIPVVQVDGPIRPVDIACLNCPPINWLNPGDLVTVELPFQNVLPIDTVDLTATLLPSAQITPLSGTQDYGILRGQGAAIKRSFTFHANFSTGPGPLDNGTSCGDTVQLIFQLQDQTNNLGQVSVPFRMAVPFHPLVEEFDEAPVPTLPPGWDTTATGTSAPWMTTSNTPPNSIPANSPDDVPDRPGETNGPPNVSAFAPALAGAGQSFLYARPFTAASTRAETYFRQSFSVSNKYDGCILELSIGGQAFQEFTQAGGTFLLNGYNTLLNDFNPMGPRPAWTGNSGGWLPVQIRLPVTTAAQPVQLRWHFATSRGLTNGGWYIDSVAVTDPQCLPAVTNPVILKPGITGGLFSFSVGTIASRTYTVEYKTNLNDIDWQFFQTLSGNGATQTLTMPIGPGNQKFFRFRVQ
jgi:hypothetical protein